MKYAGAPTVNYTGVREEAVTKLKDSVSKYKELEHPSLIRFIYSESIADGYSVVFKWAEGDSMGRMYPESHKNIMALPNEVKHSIFSSIIDFIEYTNNRGYDAVDFYDGSIMYDVKSATTTICDIDYYEIKPFINKIGRLPGSGRFMSPEEYVLSEYIDEITNVFRLGRT